MPVEHRGGDEKLSINGGCSTSKSCAQHNFDNEDIQIVYCYKDYDPYTVLYTVCISRIYPKDKNPRRHLRELLPANQRI